jgi:glucosamine-6-phosphate deaminase
VVQLDDYLDLEEGDPRSLFRWMERALLIPLGIERDRTLPIMSDGDEDPELACRAYDAQIEALGGIDLAILGLGLNGHLGFNEPPSSADAPTRVVSLTPESIESNAAYWNEGRVPDRAVTAGMSVILAARRVLVLVSGATKAPVLARLLKTEADSWLPASHLHRHPNASILADRAAAQTTRA